MRNACESVRPIDPVEILGITVHPLTIRDLHGRIQAAVDGNERWIIAHHNLHSLYIVHHDAMMQRFYSLARYRHIDGMSLVLLGRLLGLPLQRTHRVTYVDWVRPLMAEAAKRGWRVFYLGSKPGVAEQAVDILRQEYPALQIASAHGYFSPERSCPENQAVLADINGYKPQVLMVGMGMPRQEHWILDNISQVSANVILTSGACMDYVAGAIPTPPRWMGRIGLEWLFRLLSEPHRLATRYLVEPWFVARLLLRSLVDKYT